MTYEIPGKKVRSFCLSATTVDSIRADIEKGAAEDTYGQEYVTASRKMPLFVTVPLADDRALIGVQEENRSNDENTLIFERPTEKLEPLSLISSAIFVGRASCHIQFIAGDYSEWIYLPDC